MQEIYIIDKKDDLKERLQQSLKNRKFKLKKIKEENIDIALKDIPALIIINEDNINGDLIEICKQIRNNEDNVITPIIVISSKDDQEHILYVLKCMVTYYIKNPVNIEIISYTIKNIIDLLYMNRKVSPLTNLPGNIQIQAEMKKRLFRKEYFVMLYVDLDNFKAYNDVYGFANGDEIIKFTARTISKHVHQIPDSDNFIGHIGGDDFVAITSKTDYDKVCQEIIIEFDKYAVDFYNEIDVERGYVEVANRRGIIEQFPLTTISIAVLEVDSKIYKTTLEIGEVAGQIKHQAKTVLGSSYIINRRRF